MQVLNNSLKRTQELKKKVDLAVMHAELKIIALKISLTNLSPKKGLFAKTDLFCIFFFQKLSIMHISFVKMCIHFLDKVLWGFSNKESILSYHSLLA